MHGSCSGVYTDSFVCSFIRCPVRARSVRGPGHWVHLQVRWTPPNLGRIPLTCPHRTAVLLLEDAEGNKTKFLEVIIGWYFDLAEKNWIFNTVTINGRSLGEMDLCSHVLHQNKYQTDPRYMLKTNKTQELNVAQYNICYTWRGMTPMYIEHLKINKEEENKRKREQKPEAGHWQ